MSIVRIGLSETSKFAEGYEAIFGKKRGETPKKAVAIAKKSTRKKRKSRKK